MIWSMRTNSTGLDLEQARQHRRDLDAGEALLAADRVAQADGDREAERADVRERMARIDGERCEDREDLVVEPLAERGVVLRDGAVIDDVDLLARQLALQPSVDRRLLRDELQDPRPDRGKLVGRRATVGGDRRGGRLPLASKARDAHLEELVQVAREDGQELDPLEQRIAIVAGLVQDPRVELEPGELTIEIPAAQGVVDALAGPRRTVGGSRTHSGHGEGRTLPVEGPRRAMGRRMVGGRGVGRASLAR